MEHEKKHHQGWVNLYRGHSNTPPRVNGFVHPTEHVAKEVAKMHGDDSIATVKVEWEEK
ncbi:hypothetical protein [Ralstonia mannitolilytica]|uniref:hypothetical protein n=1 Tax=Ralstonia mannitolilytica TaxID=105219 RepID=UPI00374931D3